MFTGIVEETGRVAGFARGAAAWRLRIAAARALEGARLGDSIAVNGCCLTVATLEGAEIGFDVLEETRRLTNFSSLRPGAAVNLERSLPVGGRLGGHFVSGHIDETGAIEVFEAHGADHYMRIRASREGSRYLVTKGSVAVDGVSLTIAETAGEAFAVWLIPATLAGTNLPERRIGDAVNLEFDLLGKYIEKLMQHQPI